MCIPVFVLFSKASQSLGFLKRNLHSAKPETKQAAYNSIVRPTLEYSSAAWDPHTQNDIHTLQMQANVVFGVCYKVI